jgi:hypothetical protein
VNRLILAGSLLFSFCAAAQEVTERAGAPRTDLIGLEVSLKAGGAFPQLMNPLSTTFEGVLKVGFSPLANKQLQLLAEAGYSQPSYSFASSDSRLGEASRDFHSTLTVRDLGTLFGAQYFFRPLDQVLIPYAGAGLQVHFLAMDVEADGGGDFGAHRETSTRAGGAAFGGAAFKLGPGLLLGELRAGYAPVKEVVSGVSNIGRVSVMLGYGILL